MKMISNALKLYTPKKEELIAHIALNGYRIQAGIAALPHGTMSSFMVVEGDLWDYLDPNAELLLEQEDGSETAVRIAALPAEDDGFGLIEFL